MKRFLKIKDHELEYFRKAILCCANDIITGKAMLGELLPPNFRSGEATAPLHRLPRCSTAYKLQYELTGVPCKTLLHKV